LSLRQKLTASGYFGLAVGLRSQHASLSCFTNGSLGGQHAAFDGQRDGQANNTMPADQAFDRSVLAALPGLSAGF
jgi:hypothetical protein